MANFTDPPYLVLDGTNTTAPTVMLGASGDFTTTDNATTAAAAVNDIFARYTLMALLETFAPAGILAERMVPPLWYVLGFLGNPVSAVIWYGRRMRRNNSSAVYLGTLAVSDTVFLFLHFLHYLHAAWGHTVYNTEAGCEAFMFFFYAPQYLSVVLVAAFTVERYVAVCHPFLKEKWCTVRLACLVVVVLVVFSVALASAQAYIWTYIPEMGVCSIRPEAGEGAHDSFWSVWSWVVDMTVFAAVPLAVLVFNVLVLREIIRLSRNGVVTRQQQQGRGGGSGSNNTASTVTLLSVSFFLVVTQLIATLVNNLQLAFPMGALSLTDEELRADPTWSRLFSYMDARKIVDALCLSHFACYFIVYALTGKHFRREVIYLVTCHGNLHCMDFLFAKAHKGERYSMVSSNGHTLATDTCTTAFTTTM